MIKYLQTPFHFDVAPLQREVSRLSGNYWKEHYNKTHYEGEWSILPLRAIHGDMENTVSIQANSGIPYQDTALLEQCPFLRSVIDAFACEKTSVRLMKLNAGALIKEHTDQDMHVEAGEARLHIPVQTNPDVAFYIQEERIPMPEGSCWYLNLSLPHRVHNAGHTDRVHLVVDCVVNDWVTALLQDATLHRKDIAGLPSRSSYSLEDTQKIIAELRKMNTSSSLAQALLLEAGLPNPA